MPKQIMTFGHIMPERRALHFRMGSRWNLFPGPEGDMYLFPG